MDLVPMEFDQNNPRSVVNLVPQTVRDAINAIPPEMFDLGVADLRQRYAARYTETIERLRVAFWLEYDRCQEKGMPMRIEPIIHGSCSRVHFMRVIQDPTLLAYIVTPPTSYSTAMNRLLDLSLERMREVIEMPIYDSKGKPNAKVAAIILAAFDRISNQVKGSVVQRVEQKTLNVNVEQKIEDTSIENIDKRLAELEAKARPVVREIEYQRISEGDQDGISDLSNEPAQYSGDQGCAADHAGCGTGDDQDGRGAGSPSGPADL